MPEITEAALVEAMARAMSKPLANMYGGCFKPEARDQRSDCADGDCYCARVGKHCARAALAAIREAATWHMVVKNHVRGTDFPKIELHFSEHDYDAQEKAAALLRALAGEDAR